MRNDGQKPQGGGAPRPGRTNGFIPSSFRTLSGYLRIVSSGASTVASTVRSAASAASAIVDRDNDACHDQVLWAGFDKLECEGDLTRQLLLLGYRLGFQVWDVEEADNVHDLVSRYDGPVSFMQMLPKPLPSKRQEEKFAESRPLLAACADGSLSGCGNIQDVLATPSNGISQTCQDEANGGFAPNVVWFYSLRSQSYIHVLKFRSVVCSVRCSARVVAVAQTTQIHCFDAATLEREYTIMTNPVVTGLSGFGGIGYGPLAVGPRWLAYSGSPVSFSNSGRVNPQSLISSACFPSSTSNGSLVAHYAKASSKHLAAGLVTLGDMGYKKLSRYCSELVPDSTGSAVSRSPGGKVNGTANGHLGDSENVGMVIVRDIVNKSVIAQFRAHKSPISSLCFDPIGTLLVTASVQGHNINVFQIMPRPAGCSSVHDLEASYLHLYRLQRGLTNAVIQDICFSDDSNWIMISSSKGTSHLFALSPSGGAANFQSADTLLIARNSGSGVMSKPAVRWPPNSDPHMLNQHNFSASGPPITLSVVSRIRSGANGWRNTVNSAAAAATGRNSSLSGAVASAFCSCKVNDLCEGSGSLNARNQLMVFSPSGCLIQYALRAFPGLESGLVVHEFGSSYESGLETDSSLVVEAIKKWNICQKQNRREREDNIDIYGENGKSDGGKIFPEEMQRQYGGFAEARGSVTKLKIGPEERHHVFISEAELQMHQARILLWAKPEIYFQPMVKNATKIDGEDASHGEIQIERIPTRMIEARSKNLVPVFDYLRSPKLPQASTTALYGDNNGQLLQQTAGLSENGRLLCRSNSSSLDSLTGGCLAVAAMLGDMEETASDGADVPTETTKSFVNSNDIPKSDRRLGTVNNREGPVRQVQSKFVNSNRGGSTVENQFEDEGDEFD